MKKRIINKTSIHINRAITVLICLLVFSLVLLVVISDLSGRHFIFINNSGKICGGIQKTINTALTGNDISGNIIFIDQLIDELEKFITSHPVVFSNTEINKISRLKDEWVDLQMLLSEAKPDPDEVFARSNSIWTLSDEIVGDIENKSHSFIRYLYVVSVVIISVILTLILLIIIIRVVIQNRLETQAAKDKLTGLYNRNYFNDFIKTKIAELKNSDDYLALLLCDIDHFKYINDTMGHDDGDRILKETASVLNNSIRADDVLFRFGGEEFLIITNFDKHQNLLTFGERVRRNMEEHDFGGRKVTISIGVAVYRNSAEVRDILIEADTALYKAKQKGRNQVVLFSGGL